MPLHLFFKIKVIFFLFLIYSLIAHKGLDPLIHYDFQKRFLRKNLLIAQRGPDLILSNPKFIEKKDYDLLVNDNSFLSKKGGLLLKKKLLPIKNFTIESCFFVIEKEQNKNLNGLIFSTADSTKKLEDFSQGWFFGYFKNHFVFIFNTQKGGKKYNITLQSKQKINPYQLYHAVATYDGEHSFLYINGKLSVKKKQQGQIIYPQNFNLNFFGNKKIVNTKNDKKIRDVNLSHQGAIRTLKIWDGALTAKGVNHYFLHYQEIID